MRILQMISKNDRYGAQRIFLDQVSILHALGNEVTVVGCSNDGHVSEAVRALGIPYHGISWRSIRDILFVRNLIKKKKIDVIHTTLDRADYYGMLLSRITGIPMVSTMMTFRCHHGYRIMKDVVVLSKKQKASLEKNVIWLAKISVIRPGIDVPRFAQPHQDKRNMWKKKLGTDNHTIIFSHVSNLLPRKGHMVSLELVAECKRRGENPLLLVIGDPLEGEYYHSLQRKVEELGLREQVYFTGWTFETPELLSLTHFSLLPSEREALGVVLMEGMAAGTPVIARKGEGGAELIEEYGTGFLYDPDEGVGPLADRILAVKRDTVQFQTLSDRCRRIAANEFTLSRFGGKLLELYARCGANGASLKGGV